MFFWVESQKVQCHCKCQDARFTFFQGLLGIGFKILDFSGALGTKRWYIPFTWIDEPSVISIVFISIVNRTVLKQRAEDAHLFAICFIRFHQPKNHPSDHHSCWCSWTWSPTIPYWAQPPDQLHGKALWSWWNSWLSRIRLRCRVWRDCGESVAFAAGTNTQQNWRCRPATWGRSLT